MYSIELKILLTWGLIAITYNAAVLRLSRKHSNFIARVQYLQIINF